MYLVSNSLEMEKKTIVKNMIKAIESVVSCDMANTDTDKLRERIGAAEEKKSRLLELYTSKDIERNEFIAARTKCDEEIDSLNELIRSIEKQDIIIKQQNELLLDITTAVNEIVEGMTLEEEFYRSLLDRMVVNDKDHIDVYLNLLPYKWSYTVAQAMKVQDIEIPSETEVPDSEEEVRHFSMRPTYIGNKNVPHSPLTEYCSVCYYILTEYCSVRRDCNAENRKTAG